MDGATQTNATEIKSLAGNIRRSVEKSAKCSGQRKVLWRWARGEIDRCWCRWRPQSQICTSAARTRRSSRQWLEDNVATRQLSGATYDHSHESSQGRRATHSIRFSAALHNSRADTPWSSSSCAIHERRGRSAGRLQPLYRQIPLRLSTLSRRAVCAGVLGSSRRTWPKSEWRLLAIILRTFESLVRRWTSTLGTKSNHWMPRTGRWQLMWNAWTHQLPSASIVRVSDSYNGTGITHVE